MPSAKNGNYSPKIDAYNRLGALQALLKYVIRKNNGLFE